MSGWTTNDTAVTGGELQRVRVRTPGKHIVLFAIAITLMLALSATILSNANVSLPDYDFTQAGSEAGPFYAPAEEFIVDLAPDAEGRVAMAKIVIRVAASDQAQMKTLAAHRPAIRERVGFFLRELSPEDFEGTERMARLKTELMKRVNLSLAPDTAADILIETLAIQ